MLLVKKLLGKIANHQSDLIKVVHAVSLTNSGSVAAGASTPLTQTSISHLIPDGYKLLAVTFRGTTNAKFFCWYLDWVSVDERVDYRVTNTGSSAASISPTVNLIFIKIGGGIG